MGLYQGLKCLDFLASRFRYWSIFLFSSRPYSNSQTFRVDLCTRKLLTTVSSSGGFLCLPAPGLLPPLIYRKGSHLINVLQYVAKIVEKLQK